MSEITDTKSSISSFLNNFGNFARQNRFEVEFNTPSGIKDSINSDIKLGMYNQFINSQNFTMVRNQLGSKVSISCFSAQMPAQAINNTEHYRSNTKFPNRYTVDLVSFSFYCDENMTQRKFFEYWCNTVVNKNQTLNFYDEYVSDIKIYQLNRKGERTYCVRLDSAYPINLSSVDYSFQNENTIQSINVSFNYEYWESIPV